MKSSFFEADAKLFEFIKAGEASQRPKVVCLCGSTRFYSEFQRQNYEETMRGRIVLSVGFYPHSASVMHGQEIGCSAEQKVSLDQLHFRKIDLADEIFVLNVGGYIGESTANEIAYAITTGKPVRYLEPTLDFQNKNHWAARYTGGKG